jgi:hypothetical protein
MAGEINKRSGSGVIQLIVLIVGLVIYLSISELVWTKNHRLYSYILLVAHLVHHHQPPRKEDPWGERAVATRAGGKEIQSTPCVSRT